MGLDGVELIAKVEEEFRISFTDDEAIKISTFGEFCDAISRKVHVSEYTERHICERVRSILADQFGVPLEAIQSAARLVEDLGLN